MVRGSRKSYIHGFEGLYEITEHGEVRVINSYVPEWDHYRLLKSRVDRGGYLSVRLSKDGKTYTRFVHRLIADRFVKYNPDKPFVNHRDGNKLNNSLENLEFVTHRENVQAAYDIGLNKLAKPVIDTVTGKKFPSISAAARFCQLPVRTCAARLKNDSSFRLRFLPKR